MKFDERNPKLFQIPPFFVSMATVDFFKMAVVAMETAKIQRN
jgi:hypothetical protein